MPYSRTIKERFLDNEREVMRAVAIGLGVIVAGIIAWHYFSPKPERKAPSVSPAVLAADAAEVAAGLQETERRFHQMEASGETLPVLQKWLELEIEQAMLRRRGTFKVNEGLERARVSWLETRLSEVRSRQALQQSWTAEQRAREAQARGQISEHLDSLSEALRLQREANRLTAKVSIADVERERKLADVLEMSETLPLEEAIGIEIARADRAGDTTVALEALEAAAEKMRELARRSADNPLARPPRLAEIERRIASIKSQTLADRITALEKTAQQAESAGETAKAAEALAQAAGVQRELNEQFPASQHASADRVTELQRRREAVLSRAALRRLEELDPQIASLLHGGQVAAAIERVGEASGLVDQVVRDFPLIGPSLAGRRVRLDYLWLRQRDISDLQAQLAARLAPLPGSPRGRITSEKISQEFYAKIANDNPSALVDPKRAVESVTWLEAQTFCERLSWILGAKVRLPTVAEFQGREGRKPESASLGRGQVSDAVPEGLAEWLQEDQSRAAMAPVGGLRYADGKASLSSDKIAYIAKTLRLRSVGFRVVVER